jgi:hypothetical protein
MLEIRVARFFLVQFTNTGENIPNFNKIHLSNGHKILLSWLDLAVCTTECDMKIIFCVNRLFVRSPRQHAVDGVDIDGGLGQSVE